MKFCYCDNPYIIITNLVLILSDIRALNLTESVATVSQPLTLYIYIYIAVKHTCTPRLKKT